MLVILLDGIKACNNQDTTGKKQQALAEKCRSCMEIKNKRDVIHQMNTHSLARKDKSKWLIKFLGKRGGVMILVNYHNQLSYFYLLS